MRNFTGYFLLASKFGGRTRKPSTLSPFAPGSQKDSSGDMVTWDRTASLKCVSWMGEGSRLGGMLILWISDGASSDIRVTSSDLPSGVGTKSPSKKRWYATGPGSSLVGWSRTT